MPAVKTKITDETEVSTTELAAVLGITARRVQQLAQDGKFVPVKKGRYRLAECVQIYIKSVARDDIEVELEKKLAEVKLKNAKAEMAELETDELRGKMHRSEDVEAITLDLIYAVRSALLALPGRLAIDVVNANSTPEAAEIIKKEVFKLMKELSSYKYDPKAYEERVRKRKDWELKDYEEAES